MSMASSSERPSFSTWEEQVQHRVRMLFEQVASMRAWVHEAGWDEAQADRACTAYYGELERLYERELPLGRAFDSSDLLVYLDGEPVRGDKPSIALVNSWCNNVRRNLGIIAKAVAGIQERGKPMPREMNFGLTAIARGSLYIGFALPDPSAPFRDGHPKLLGEEDPYHHAARASLTLLGTASRSMDEPDAIELIREEIPDPKHRDAALLAVELMSPTTQSKLTRVGLAGRALPDDRWRHLTPGTRRRVHEWLKNQVRSKRRETFAGIVRSMDLDILRFDLREVIGGEVTDIRCVYNEGLRGIDEGMLNKKVKVSGRVDCTPDGKPRLMQVERVDVLG